MAKVAAFLAEGFEEVEALTVIDLLRRGNVEVTTVSIMGDKNLKAHKELAKVILDFDRRGKKLAAICAAPTVYGELGILKGKNATCYPGCESGLLGANYITDSVVEDSHFITSRGVGTAIDMGLKLVSVFKGEEASKALGKAIVYL